MSPARRQSPFASAPANRIARESYRSLAPLTREDLYSIALSYGPAIPGWSDSEPWFLFDTYLAESLRHDLMLPLGTACWGFLDPLGRSARRGRGRAWHYFLVLPDGKTIVDPGAEQYGNRMLEYGEARRVTNIAPLPSEKRSRISRDLTPLLRERMSVRNR